MNEKSYASEMKRRLDTSLYSIQIALERLELGGILVRQPLGKTQIYQFNPRYPFLGELKAFLQKSYEALPKKMKTELYEAPVRRRPRRKGKPLLKADGKRL